MATAGPGKDGGLVIITSPDGNKRTVKCSRCQEVLVELTVAEQRITDITDVITGDGLKEAIDAHVCGGKRVGRITED